MIHIIIIIHAFHWETHKLQLKMKMYNYSIKDQFTTEFV